MARSLIKIEVIANDCCGDIGDSVYKYRLKFTRNIIWGYSRLHRLMLGEKKTKTAILPYDNAISLPCDFSLISKVGVRREPGGCIAILSVASEADRWVLGDTDCCDYLNTVWDGCWTGGGYPFANAWGSDGYYGELYGMGRTIINNGTYYVDKSNGTLYIGSNIPVGAEVIIEYVSDGVTSGISVVPTEMIDCLTYWAKFKYYADKNPALSDRNHVLYKKEYNSLKSQYQHKTPAQIGVAVNEAISPSNY